MHNNIKLHYTNIERHCFNIENFKRRKQHHHKVTLWDSRSKAKRKSASTCTAQ